MFHNLIRAKNAPAPTLITLIGATSSSSGTIDLPSGLAENDIVIVASFGNAATPDYPTGYTAGYAGITNNVGRAWSWKRMGSTPDTTASGLSNSSTTYAHIALAFRNVHTSTTFDQNTSQATTTSGMPNPGPITINLYDTVAVSFGCLLTDKVAATVGPPTDFTLAIASDNEGACNGTIMAAYKRFETAQSRNPSAFTSTGGDDYTAAWSVCLHQNNDGGQVFFSASNTWVVPSGVTSAHILALGAGGDGGSSDQTCAGGGGGGGLSYSNNVAVTPTESLTITVDTNYSKVLRSSTILVSAHGGANGDTYGEGGPGGLPSDGVGTVKYAGGNGGNGDNTAYKAGGGGGASGYSGNGGDGGSVDFEDDSYIAPTAGSGGGGGGGFEGSVEDSEIISGGGGGGGIYPYGEGTSGVQGGHGGSGGGNGYEPSIINPEGGWGGLYGGGGGGAGWDTNTTDPFDGGAGQGGFVKIIWGTGRAWPSTRIGDV